jgi:hypothetical protein
MVVEQHEDVGTGPRLDCRRDSRLQVVAVDRLQVDLDAERLLALGDQLLAQELIGRGDEVVPAQPIQGRALSIGGRPAGRQDGGHAAGLRRQRSGARYLQEFTARDTSHALSSHVDLL